MVEMNCLETLDVNEDEAKSLFVKFSNLKGEMKLMKNSLSVASSDVSSDVIFRKKVAKRITIIIH